MYIYRGRRKVDLWSICQFWGHLIWVPKFKKNRKRKSVLYKNEKLPSATRFSKLNNKSEHINTVN